ncbi:hypothetical protein EVAR_83942_1 [Eumeta japonica]|uniref:Mos1 transposase HTH domain-containing protein n=1 Tax=Eumeta variegata TaxID=151549 RepID=A0A4C1XSM2_EUMVA|nr:hypothetical protein EVAR_83942_1 [Eumeta japonica]
MRYPPLDRWTQVVGDGGGAGHRNSLPGRKAATEAATHVYCIACLQNGFGIEAPHLDTVRRWYAEFVRGRVSIHDEIREGRPSAAITEENVATDLRKSWGKTNEKSHPIASRQRFAAVRE